MNGDMKYEPILLAGVRFAVYTNSKKTAERLAEFRGDFGPNDAQAAITLTGKKVQRERELAENGGFYAEHTLELIVLHREVAELLPRFNALAAHASVIEMDGKGVIFLGESGAGKSTHSRLWRERFGERVSMINDDKPLLRLENGRFWVCGSPWKGKHGLGNSSIAPLCAAVFINKAKTDSVRAMSAYEYWRLMPAQVLIPNDAGRALNALSLLDKLKTTGVKVLSLNCTAEHSAAELACRAVFGELPKD